MCSMMRSVNAEIVKKGLTSSAAADDQALAT
jgi:hypothetical protein